MVNIEYRIGKIEINEKDLSYPLAHQFLVASNGSGVPDLASLEIYIASLKNHPKLVAHFKLRKDKVRGGGKLYLQDGLLVFHGFSHVFGPIPREVAEGFARIVEEEFKRRGLEVKQSETDVVQKHLEPFWEELGFIDESQIQPI